MVRIQVPVSKWSKSCQDWDPTQDIGLKQAPGFKQKLSCHLLFKTSTSTKSAPSWHGLLHPPNFGIASDRGLQPVSGPYTKALHTTGPASLPGDTANAAHPPDAAPRATTFFWAPCPPRPFSTHLLAHPYKLHLTYTATRVLRQTAESLARAEVDDSLCSPLSASQTS